MMKPEGLDREDLEALVNGVVPNYGVMGHPLVKRAGSYMGGFHDKWNWTYPLTEFSDNELWEIYQVCKNSWK